MIILHLLLKEHLPSSWCCRGNSIGGKTTYVREELKWPRQQMTRRQHDRQHLPYFQSDPSLNISPLFSLLKDMQFNYVLKSEGMVVSKKTFINVCEVRRDCKHVCGGQRAIYRSHFLLPREVQGIELKSSCLLTRAFTH